MLATATNPIQNDNPQRLLKESIISKIGDVIRGTLIAQDLDQIPLILSRVQELVKNHRGKLYLKNFWADRKHLTMGYVGAHMKICIPLPNGRHLLMELQIHVKDIMDGTENCAKEITHRLYKNPEEGSEGFTSLDVISASQLIFLASIVRLLYPREELEKVKNTLDLLQAMTKINDKMRLVMETALLLGKEEICLGDWNERLQAVVPKDKAAVQAAWAVTAEKVNNRLNLPVLKMDNDGPWANTATTVDELYEDAMQMAPIFKEISELAVKDLPGCAVNFGPENGHMIKERESLLAKIDKDIRAAMEPQVPKEAEYKVSETESKKTLTRTFSSFFPRLQQQMLHPISLKQQHLSFIGRENELQTMSTMIDAKKIITLWGPGGIGKTELAITFANKHLNKYSLVWFIPSFTEEERLTAYIELATVLNLRFHPGQPKEELFRSVHLKLENRSGKPWLLIYDGVASFQHAASQYPSRGGHILITSLAKNPNTHSIQISTFSTSEAEELMKHLTHEETSPAMHRLITLCGHYPFILDRVGMDICRTPGASIESRLRELSEDADLAGLPSQARYSKTLERVMVQTIENLPPLALKWLQACNHLHSSSIPLSYLDRWLKLQKTERVTKDSQKEIVVALSEHGIQQLEGGLLTMQHFVHRSLPLLPQQQADTHPLLIQQILAEEAMEWESLMKTDYPLALRKALIWSGHAQNFLEKPIFNNFSLEKKATLYHFLGTFKEKQLKLDAALTYHQTALELRSSIKSGVPPSSNPTVANSLTGLGKCYESQGKYKEGLKCHAEASAIYKAALGNNPHPDVAESLIGMGLCHVSLGEYEKALPVYEEALSIFKAYFGKNHPDVARSLNHIGDCYLNKRNNSRALAAYNEAFEICRMIENSPIKASSLTGQGFCYYSQEKYQEALEAHARALEIQRAAFGENHPDIAESLKAIGSCYASQGDYSRALEVFGESLKTYKTALGENHSDVALTLHEMGDCHAYQEHYEEALNTYNQALKIQMAAFGQNHPDVAVSLQAIGHCYYLQEDYAKTLEMSNEALMIFKHVLEKNHPDIANCLDNVGTCYELQGNHLAALKVYTEAFEIYRASGENYTEKASACLGKIQRCKAHLKIGTGSIKIRKEHLTPVVGSRPKPIQAQEEKKVESSPLHFGPRQAVPENISQAQKPMTVASNFEFKGQDEARRQLMIRKILDLINTLNFKKEPEKLSAATGDKYACSKQGFPLFHNPWQLLKTKTPPKNRAMFEVLQSAIRALEQINYDVLLQAKKEYQGEYDLVQTLCNGVISVHEKRKYANFSDFVGYISDQPGFLVAEMLLEVEPYLLKLHKKYKIPIVQHPVQKFKPRVSHFKEYDDEDDYGRKSMIIEVQDLIYALGFEAATSSGKVPAPSDLGKVIPQAFFGASLKSWEKIKVHKGHKNIAMYDVLKSAIQALEEVNYDILHKEKANYSRHHDYLYSWGKGRVSLETNRAHFERHSRRPFRIIHLAKQPATLVDLMLTKVTTYLLELHKKYDIPVTQDENQKVVVHI